MPARSSARYALTTLLVLLAVSQMPSPSAQAPVSGPLVVAQDLDRQADAGRLADEALRVLALELLVLGQAAAEEPLVAFVHRPRDAGHLRVHQPVHGRRPERMRARHAFVRP